MTSVTRRAVRTTAAIAGIAALGTGLAGAAAALPTLDDLPLADALQTDAVPDLSSLVPAGAHDTAAVPALSGVELPKLAAPMGDGLPELPAVPGLPSLAQLPEAAEALAMAQETLDMAQETLDETLAGVNVTPPSLLPAVPDVPEVPDLSDVPALAKSLADQAMSRQISGNTLAV